MTEIEFLSWVRGTGFQIAVVIFIAGIIIRFAEILMLGRKTNLAEAERAKAELAVEAQALRDRKVDVRSSDLFREMERVNVAMREKLVQLESERQGGDERRPQGTECQSGGRHQCGAEGWCRRGGVRREG